MSPTAKLNLASLGTIAGIVAAAVGAIVFIANANQNAAAAVKSSDDLQTRVRTLEQFVPRIDERLIAIDRKLDEHRRETMDPKTPK